MTSHHSARAITSRELFANLTRVLDDVRATGKPIHVVHAGRTVVVQREPPRRTRASSKRTAK